MLGAVEAYPSVQGRIKQCTTKQSLQWLAVGVAIANKHARDTLDISGFDGNAREVLRLLKAGEWNESGNRAITSAGVHMYKGEKLIDSIIATVAEESVCRMNSQEALNRRMERKRKAAQ